MIKIVQLKDFQNGELYLGLGVRAKVVGGDPQGEFIELFFNRKRLAGPDVKMGDFLLIKRNDDEVSYEVPKLPENEIKREFWVNGYRKNSYLDTKELFMSNYKDICFKKIWGNHYLGMQIDPADKNCVEPYYNKDGKFLLANDIKFSICKNNEDIVALVMWGKIEHGVDNKKKFAKLWYEHKATIDQVKQVLSKIEE